MKRDIIWRVIDYAYRAYGILSIVSIVYAFVLMNDEITPTLLFTIGSIVHVSICAILYIRKEYWYGKEN